MYIYHYRRSSLQKDSSVPNMNCFLTLGSSLTTIMVGHMA